MSLLFHDIDTHIVIFGHIYPIFGLSVFFTVYFSCLHRIFALTQALTQNKVIAFIGIYYILMFPAISHVYIMSPRWSIQHYKYAVLYS
jgi:hypothetical protein